MNTNRITEFEKYSLLPSKTQILINLEEIDSSKTTQPLFSHLIKYSEICWLDIYKFILQGTCGWAHLEKNNNRDLLKQRLVKELHRATNLLKENSLFELLNERTNIGRINLRVWKANYGLNIEPLWELILLVPRGLDKPLLSFQQQWYQILNLWEKEILYSKNNQAEVAIWINYVKELALKAKTASDLPVVSHSPKFRRTYQPTYRLVRREDLEKFQVDNQPIQANF